MENEVNMPVDFMPSKANSETFIKEFCDKYHYDFDCAFKVLLPRSELAQDNFKELLEASKNYELNIVPAYNTVLPDSSLKIDDFKAVLFMSKSCVDNFMRLTNKMNLSDKTIYSIGAKTSKAFLEHYPDFANLIEADEANIESLLKKAVIC